MKIRPLVQNAGKGRGGRRGHRRHGDLTQQELERVQCRAPGIFAFSGVVGLSPEVAKGRRLVTDEGGRRRSSGCSAAGAGQSGIPASTAKEPVGSEAFEMQRR